jgi:hypothetical protein
MPSNLRAALRQGPFTTLVYVTGNVVAWVLWKLEK